MRAWGPVQSSFAAVVMIVGGFFAFFEGLAALLKSGRFYTTVANYPYGGNVKTWGWIVLIAGIVVSCWRGST